MNKERLHELADLIENQGIAFNENVLKFRMNNWFSKRNCETFACIAGHTVCHFEPKIAKNLIENRAVSWADEAQKILNISNIEAAELFGSYLLAPKIYYSDITNKVAAQTIRHFVETGIIDFNKFIKIVVES